MSISRGVPSAPDPTQRSSDPPGAWPAARAVARRVLSPVERFLSVEASSGVVLIVAAVAALLWANSPWAASYHSLWHTGITLGVGSYTFSRDLHFWVNDGLMTVFFFVVGLEIKRELHHGELSELRRAALPILSALGGMATPALIFLVTTAGTDAARGWGVPMATDIAFAVGVLALLGQRVPPALRILLLTLAVIDDLGAILVIAIFYSSGLNASGALLAALGLLALGALQMLGIRRPVVYIIPGVAVWAGVYRLGVHPTLAGVLLGLLTPAKAWFRADDLERQAEAALTLVRRQHPFRHDALLLPELQHLNDASREASAPVDRLQHLLHGWVAFGVMPIFALANAGVTLDGTSPGGSASRVILGVTLGLVVGKPTGVLLFAWVGTKLGVARLPRGVTWRHVLVAGLVAGIGFTMAIFIASLAFPSGALLESAKLAVLASSAGAGLIALVVGRLLLPARPAADAATTERAAEASTET